MTKTKQNILLTSRLAIKPGRPYSALPTAIRTISLLKYQGMFPFPTT